METIIHKHGNRYPRPTLPCTECGGTLVLCYGEKVQPYMRNKTSNKNCKGGSGEGILHRLAKQLLVDFLNENGELVTTSQCIYCPYIYKETFSGEAKEEVSIGNSRADVAIFHEGEIVSLVEIFDTHRTVNTEERNKYPWREVSAQSLIEVLDVLEVPKKIELKNMLKIHCNDCEKKHEKKVRENSITNSHIAEQLGYYRVNEQKDVLYYKKIAVTGKYNKITSWNVLYNPLEKDYETLNTLRRILPPPPSGHGWCNRTRKMLDMQETSQGRKMQTLLWKVLFYCSEF